MCERLYRNELTRLGYGNPVWEPSPGTLYDRVRIGDVGYFERGKFFPMFNILPPDDSTPNRRLPFHRQPNFPALHLPTSPTNVPTNPLQPGTYALESSVSAGVDSVGSVLHGESSISFTNEKGAALILPYEASREDTMYAKLFREHMLKHHQQWYNFAIDELYRDIKLHELILVTGCDLTRQWETATYFRNNQDINAALGTQVAPIAGANFSLSAGWRVTQNVPTRRGPTRALNQQPPQNSEGGQNEREHLDNTECIFIRGVYVKDRIWRSVGYDDPGKYGPEEEGADAVLDDEDVTVQSILPSTKDETFINVLLDHMLEESIADVVIASDSDLWPFLEEAENPETLRDTLKRKSPRISVEDGVGSLLQ